MPPEAPLDGSPGSASCLLHLFVTGASPRSTAAVARVRGLCERLLPGRYVLEVIDIYQQPARARLHRVMVAPTLVRQEPSPARRLVGNFSDHLSLLEVLGLPVGKA